MAEIRRIVRAAELPVSTQVGGCSPSHVSPGRGRNRTDLLVESRRALGMAVPSEWLTNATTVQAGDVVSETTATTAVRANAVSPLTIIPESARR